MKVVSIHSCRIWAGSLVCLFTIQHSYTITWARTYLRITANKSLTKSGNFVHESLQQIASESLVYCLIQGVKPLTRPTCVRIQFIDWGHGGKVYVDCNPRSKEPQIRRNLQKPELSAFCCSFSTLFG